MRVKQTSYGRVWKSCVASVNMSRYAVPVTYLHAKSELHTTYCRTSIASR